MDKRHAVLVLQDLTRTVASARAYKATVARS